MITEEKIKAVQKQLRNGIPQGEIENDLIKEGYTKDDIKKLFVAHKYDMRSWYLFFAIIFLLAAIWFFNMLLAAGAAIMFAMYYNESQKMQKERSL